MMKYRFKSLNISNVGPFGTNNVLSLKDGMNVIAGQNCVGKTILANALLGNISNVPIKISGKKQPYEPFLTSWGSDLYDQRKNLPVIGRCYSFYERIISKGLVKTKDIAAFWKEISDGTNQGLRDKWDVKFILNVDNENRLTALDLKTGKDALGFLTNSNDMYFVHLALLGAIKKFHRPALDIPFVIDGLGGSHDNSGRNGIMEILPKLSPQVVLIDTPWNLEGYKIDFNIIRGMSGISNIKKVVD